jgi:hypothetical protein
MALASAFLVPFLAALPRVNPAYGPVDAPELLSAGLVLGVAHPPGYLLLSLLERLALLLPVGGPAFRMNLVGPVALGLAAAGFASLARRLAPPAPALGLSLVLALFPAVLGAANDAKGGAMLVSLALFVGAMASSSSPRGGARTWLLLGLSVAHNALAAVPALAGAAALGAGSPRGRGRRIGVRLFLLGAGAGLLLCGIIRAAARPAVCWGRWDRLDGLLSILSWARGWPEFGAGGVWGTLGALSAYHGVPLALALLAVAGWAFGRRDPAARFSAAAASASLLLLPHDTHEPGMLYTLPLVPCALLGSLAFRRVGAAAARRPGASTTGALALAAALAVAAPPGAGRLIFMDDLARNTLAEVPAGKSVLFVLGDYDYDAVRFRKLAFGEKPGCAVVRVTALGLAVYGDQFPALKAAHPWLAVPRNPDAAGVARANAGRAWVGATCALRMGWREWPALHALAGPGGSFTVPLAGSRGRGKAARARARGLFDERAFAEEWARRFRRMWKCAAPEGPYRAF